MKVVSSQAQTQDICQMKHEWLSNSVIFVGFPLLSIVMYFATLGLNGLAQEKHMEMYCYNEKDDNV